MKTSEDRPEYIKCIKGHDEYTGLCGRKNVNQFMFVDHEHAEKNAEQQGRLITCEACNEMLKAAIKVLKND